MSTDQEFFDKTVNHFIAQGHRAIDPTNNRCLYRAPNGDQCAAGCHIPDECYDPFMEEMGSIQTVLSERPTIRQFFPNLNLAMELQHIHDSVEYWVAPVVLRTRLVTCANRFNLNSDVVQNLKTFK